MIVRVSKYGTGEEIARRLEENNIVCNYQALPDDESFIKSSGIRTGVQEMTRFGMTEEDFGHLAELMADVIVRNKNVAQEVEKYRQNFLEMKYCLPLEEAAQLAAGVLESMFPRSEYAATFAALLTQASKQA